MGFAEPRKVVQVMLLRQTYELPCTPKGWDGATSNINEGRGKTFLYLLWKAASAY